MNYSREIHVDQQRLESWIAEGWLVPQRDIEPLFSDMDVARARLIRDLKEEFGVNDEGISIALHLLDQIHGLRRHVHGLMEQLRRERRLGDLTND